MKGGVTAIGIGLAVVVLWMWGAENDIRAPAPTGSAPSTESGDAPKVPTAPESSAPGIAESDARVVAPSTTPPVEPPSPRSEPGLPSPTPVEPDREPERVLNAEPVASRPVEPAPLLSAEAVGTARPEARPTPIAPEPAPAPEAPPVAVGPPNAAPGSADDAARAGEIVAIQEVLDRYKLMYDQLDASAAPSIWPSVDSRALTRMFSRLDQQTLEFEGCVFGFWENGAAADCTGWLSYVPRVGTARREPHAWTIELTRGDEGWRILKVIAR